MGASAFKRLTPRPHFSILDGHDDPHYDMTRTDNLCFCLHTRRGGNMRSRLFLMVILLALAWSSAISADFYICGDADNSGGVDIDDVVFLINYIFAGGPYPDPYDSGDVNVSGAIDIDDAAYMIEYIFASGPAPCTDTLVDYDGNTYQTVKIGDQWWMAENLNVIHYRNGDIIPHISVESTWAGLTSGAYCEYGDIAAYGRLYNWYAVSDPRDIAPVGWHVPTDDDWKQLEMYLGMSQAQADVAGDMRGTDEGSKLKEPGTEYWHPPNSDANNESGFAARGAGCRYDFGMKYLQGDLAFFWCSDLPMTRILATNFSQVARDTYTERHGFSIRCVKN